jgi:hypothetical protein
MLAMVKLTRAFREAEEVNEEHTTQHSPLGADGNLEVIRVREGQLSQGQGGEYLRTNIPAVPMLAVATTRPVARQLTAYMR